MGIIAQRVDEGGLWFKSSSGYELTLTPIMLVANLSTYDGDKDAMIRDFVAMVAGIAEVNPQWLRFDFDTDTGQVLDFGITVDG